MYLRFKDRLSQVKKKTTICTGGSILVTSKYLSIVPFNWYYYEYYLLLPADTFIVLHFRRRSLTNYDLYLQHNIYPR